MVHRRPINTHTSIIEGYGHPHTHTHTLNTHTPILRDMGHDRWPPTHTQHPHTYVGTSLPTGGLVHLPLTHLQTVVLVKGNLLVNEIVWLLILEAVEVRHWKRLACDLALGGKDKEEKLIHLALTLV